MIFIPPNECFYSKSFSYYTKKEKANSYLLLYYYIFDINSYYTKKSIKNL